MYVSILSSMEGVPVIEMSENKSLLTLDELLFFVLECCEWILKKMNIRLHLFHKQLKQTPENIITFCS